ncbi:MAG: ribonuclease P protein component [bacterium]|nr:ribonuclease P protein component [bacterium]
MFRKENRLQKEKDIERVFKKGKGVKESFLVLKSVGNGLAENRFAVVVSQKVAKKASLRNKIRRRLREAIKEKRGRTRSGLDVVLVVLPGFEKKDFGEIKKSLTKVFLKAKLLEET